jgi:ketosteroid isomerase-like protein
MSRENVEIVRRVIDAWNRHQQERAIRYIDPEVVFDATRRRVNPKTYNGMDGMRAMLADTDEVWEEFRMEPDEFVDAGDWIVAIGRWVGKGKGSGIDVQQPVADVFRLHDGRIVRLELGYADRGKALEAAGLRSSDPTVS